MKPAPPALMESVRQYVPALLNAKMTAEDLRAGESHYTEPVKEALRAAGKGGAAPQSLTDEEAQVIKLAIRAALRLIDEGDQPQGTQRLDRLCKTLGPTSDDMDDAVNLAQGIVAVGLIALPVASVALGLGYALAGVALVRLGIRRICRRRR